MANLSSSGWSTANSPFDFRVDLFFRLVWMLVTDTGCCQDAGCAIRSADYLHAFGGRLIAQRAS
jgi:hypothetical protein